MQNKHLLVGGAKCNRAGRLPGAVGPGSHPVTHKAQGGFFGAVFNRSGQEHPVPRCPSPRQQYSGGAADAAPVFEHWRGADPVPWGGAGQAKLETLSSVSPAPAWPNRAGAGM